ncbi:hypothetical protein MTX78_02450 [Hymenobacter tibetensis]|uniref:Uncharacterized protein n=1 Tax=Hymenobacter tibetensis TaxID=497967 RepID=A0ABY4D1T3_9BACT|nr:hypothetical protein [Hymenobacter tibetensis]UOG75465.1 hypothetical protein MTX78_02450 [Hymenobacter tibetensis]
MADINIQRKKSSPGPWPLILLVLVAVGALIWYLTRKDQAQPDRAPAASEEVVPSAPDTTTGAETGPRPEANEAVANMATDASAATPDALDAATQRDPASPNYARNGLRVLSSVLTDLADRDDLRDAAVSEKRDVLTSATARLDDSTASLRPGFVAATGLLQAMQQKAFPTLEPAVGELMNRANQLSGRSTTPTDQEQLREFFTRASAVVRTMSDPTP